MKWTEVLALLGWTLTYSRTSDEYVIRLADQQIRHLILKWSSMYSRSSMISIFENEKWANGSGHLFFPATIDQLSLCCRGWLPRRFPAFITIKLENLDGVCLLYFHSGMIYWPANTLTCPWPWSINANLNRQIFLLLVPGAMSNAAVYGYTTSPSVEIEHLLYESGYGYMFC